MKYEDISVKLSEKERDRLIYVLLLDFVDFYNRILWYRDNYKDIITEDEINILKGKYLVYRDILSPINSKQIDNMLKNIDHILESFEEV